MTLGTVVRAVRRVVCRPTRAQCPSCAMATGFVRGCAARPTLTGWDRGPHRWDLFGYRYACPGVDMTWPGPS